MTKRVFGQIPGTKVGDCYENRIALSKSKVHKPVQAGISGGKDDGADSIVVSGGYVDDVDNGDVIIYTGAGGNDPATRRQVEDQELTGSNLALARSCDEGRPVRVIRGARGDTEHSPEHGYRYDGLYFIDDYWSETGIDGFRVYRFRLIQQNNGSQDEPPAPTGAADDADQPVGNAKPGRSTTTTQRVVRSSATAVWVKNVHSHRCQICELRLETPSGPYAEAAHIRPVGIPHDGPDTPENILCLCPNCHVLFDRGAVYIDSVLTVRSSADDSEIGKLTVRAKHELSAAQLEYHEELVHQRPKNLDSADGQPSS